MTDHKPRSPWQTTPAPAGTWQTRQPTAEQQADDHHDTCPDCSDRLGTYCPQGRRRAARIVARMSSYAGPRERAAALDPTRDAFRAEQAASDPRR